MNMLSEGLSTITISAPSINYSESIDIIVGKIFMVSWVGSYFYLMGGVWQVEVETVVEGNNFTSYLYGITDYSQGVAQKLHSEEREYPEGKDRITISRTVEIYAKDTSDLKQRLERVATEFNGTTKDGIIRYATGILSQKPAWL